KSGQLVGELALELPNLLGSLRYLQIDFRRLSTATQQLGIIYAEPHLGLLPLGGRVSFFQDTRDTMYVQRDIKVQLTSLPGQPWSTAIGVGRKVLRMTGDGQSEGLSYQLSSVNLELFRNALDRSNNPRRGYQVRLSLEAGTLANSELDRKAALSSTDVRVIIVGSPYVWGIANLTLAQELQATGVAGYRYAPQVADYARFGGSATLRGYREDQFAAAWGIVSRSELRYPISSSSRLYLFVDAGRLDKLDPLTAAGAGMVAAAGKNLIQLDFAWTPSDSFREGKVHLRLTNFLGANTSGQ
ncbi:MAG: BamA/TamA family outer membrane protein, partial [Candidatus Neomarinimicrobiota bacterium]